jgi:hypothetical protein
MIFVAIGAAMAAAVLVTVPEVAVLRYPIVAGSVLAVALLLSPTTFVIAGLVFFSTLQLVSDDAFSVGPANVFLSDLFLGLVALRALSPRERFTTPRRLGAFTLIAFGVWAALMVIAMARGVSGGASLDSVVRYASPLFYWPVLYFGFSRVLREVGVNHTRILHGILTVGITLIAYMFVMRILNRPFESLDSTRGHLGGVVASSGQVFHRDFGFWSAFIVYPIIALIGLGKLLYAEKRELAWLAVAGLGFVATLTTLIRSEIYGLVAGAAVLFLLSGRAFAGGRAMGARSRMATLMMIVSLVLGCGAVVASVSPSFAGVIAERSIPHYGQESQLARDNAQYRLDALETGSSVANAHSAGLGIISEEQLYNRGIDPGFLVHSGPATFLIFLGWPGLVVAALILVGLFRDSSRIRSRSPWLHSLLAGVVVMLVGNSFGAVGIVGQEYVMGIAALVIAFRFAAVDAEPAI